MSLRDLVWFCLQFSLYQTSSQPARPHHPTPQPNAGPTCFVCIDSPPLLAPLPRLCECFWCLSVGSAQPDQVAITLENDRATGPIGLRMITRLTWLAVPLYCASLRAVFTPRAFFAMAEGQDIDLDSVIDRLLEGKQSLSLSLSCSPPGRFRMDKTGWVPSRAWWWCWLWLSWSDPPNRSTNARSTAPAHTTKGRSRTRRHSLPIGLFGRSEHRGGRTARARSEVVRSADLTVHFSRVRSRPHPFVMIYSPWQPAWEAGAAAGVRDQVPVHQGARDLHQPTHPA